MTNIIHELYRCGVIQFGLFGDSPLRLNFGLLPSYPSLLATISEQLAAKITVDETQKILCSIEAIAISTLISQRTSIPLIYAQERYSSAAQDIIGAYDVGHPTAVICNVWMGEEAIDKLITKAKQGGLNVQQILCVVTVPQLTETDQVHALWSLQEILETLHSGAIINEHQVRAVIDWTTRAPDAT